MNFFNLIKLGVILIFSFGLVACAPYVANKPIIGNAKFTRSNPTLYTKEKLSIWRLQMREKLEQEAKELQEKAKEDYESSNPILDNNLF